MCQECLKQDLIIEIKQPWNKSEKKFEKAMEIVSRAFGRTVSFEPASWSKEVSPYRSVRELEEKTKQRVEKRLLELYKEIVRKWLHLEKAGGSSPFRLDGKIFINPKTGKLLTKAEWEKIKENLTKAFAMIYKAEEERLVKVAMALGKILNTMETDEAIKKKLPDIVLSEKRINTLLADPAYLSTLRFAEMHTAEYVVEITNRSRREIADVIIEGMRNQITPQKMEQQLFDQFGSINRDFRRITETEIGNNVNNGYLISELSKEEDTGIDVFMEGVSSADACSWCRSQVDGQVVVLRDNPPENGGDQVTIDGELYTVIWPGKSNIGKKRADWWVAAGLQHCHCHCSWIRHMPGFEKYEKQLKDAMAEAVEAGRKALEEKRKAEIVRSERINP